MKPQPLYLYRAERTEKWAVTADGEVIIGGLALVPHSLPDPEAFPGFVPDLLAEEVTCVGGDFRLILPREGVVEGAIYRMEIANISTDHETGYVDSYDLELSLHAALDALTKEVDDG